MRDPRRVGPDRVPSSWCKAVDVETHAIDHNHVSHAEELTTECCARWKDRPQSLVPLLENMVAENENAAL